MAGINKKLSQETNQITNLANDVRLYGIEDANGVPLSGWIDPDDIGGGEVNTASNQGGGKELVLAKDGVDLPFRTLLDGPNITITEGTDTLQFAITGLITTFEALTDTPTFAGESLKSLRLNVGETALEFYTPSAGGDFSDGGDVAGADRTLGNTDNFDLGFLTNNVNRLHIQNDGYIGIGTTSPLALLHINGTPGNINQGLVFGDGDTGIYEPSDDILNINMGGITKWQISAAKFNLNNANGAAIMGEVPSNTNPVFVPNRSDDNTGIGWKSADILSLIAGGNAVITIDGVNNNVGIGTTTPAASAKLEVDSTTGAILFPRMTTVQKNALTAVNGMIVYDSTLNKFQGYENGSWTSLI